jgi:hypothetical protein
MIIQLVVLRWRQNVVWCGVVWCGVASQCLVLSDPITAKHITHTESLSLIVTMA